MKIRSQRASANTLPCHFVPTAMPAPIFIPGLFTELGREYLRCWDLHRDKSKEGIEGAPIFASRDTSLGTEFRLEPEDFLANADDNFYPGLSTIMVVRSS